MGNASSRRLKVAIVAPPFVPVPPGAYGGTELIVAELVDGLIERGADVTLYACGTSRGGLRHGCEVRSFFRTPLWPPSEQAELEHAAFVVRDMLSRPGGFDLVHSHVPSFLPLASRLNLPVVHTIHHDAKSPHCATYANLPEVEYVAISERQQRLCGPFARAHVVHHGLDPTRYRLARNTPRDDCGVAFIGRLSRSKGPHLAIDVARAAGLRIQLGGEAHEPEDSGYFADDLEWRLACDHVTWYGPVDQSRKADILTCARALLFPISWEEPFGLVMIEAMLSGCPVVAFRRGSVPEIVEEGVTGFIVRDEEEMAAILRGPAHPARFDRARCRRRAIERFASDRMVDDYLAVYATAFERHWHPYGRAAEGGPAELHV